MLEEKRERPGPFRAFVVTAFAAAFMYDGTGPSATVFVMATVAVLLLIATGVWFLDRGNVK